jgi:exodeoxyribonuclease V alpha subunit
VEITCRFSRKIYENEKNGFCIAVYKNCGNSAFFTAKGICLPLTQKAGIDILLKGDFVTDKKYGKQFDVREFAETVRPTKKGITAYLCAMVKGIGQKTADRLYEAFGKQTLSVIEHEPERVRGVLRPEVYERLMETYRCTKSERELITFLAPYVPVNTARWLLKQLGPDALSKIKEAPFDLCNCRGIGFQKADEIARAAGYDLCAEPRIYEGVLFTLKEAQGRGHLFLTRENLSQSAYEILQKSENAESLTLERVNEVICLMVDRGKLYRQPSKAGDLIYLENTYKAERGVAVSVMRLLVRGQNQPVKSIDSFIEQVEKDSGIAYSPAQIDAIKTTFKYNFYVITGYPGTGKTTVLKGIIAVQKAIKKDPVIYLCSPTGRAARRMEEATGCPAQTIHKLLGLNGSELPEEPPILGECDLLIADEVSMLDIFLADILLYAVSAGTRVVLVGDTDQLPSVGPGAVLRELIKSRCVPVTHLDTVFRQAAQSNIILNAQAIRSGSSKLFLGNDVQFIEVESEEKAIEQIKSVYFHTLMLGNSLDDVEILTPRREKVPSSAEEINRLLRDRVNPPGPDKPEIKAGGRAFRKGDKVMQTVNTEFVNNGDIGYITQIFAGKEPSVLIRFSDGRQVKYLPDQMNMIQFAYALTVHKSQGSEFKTVILCLMNNQFDGLLKRNLVYTAITRAKEKLIIVGQKKAYERAVAHPDTQNRNTLLSARLRAFTRQYMKQLKKKSA